MPKRVARQTFDRQKLRYYAKHRRHSGRRRYSANEDERIMAHSMLDVDLAKQLGRSVQAIHIRRCKLRDEFNGDAGR